MSSYWRDCKFCGQKILMVQGSYSWQPMEADGTGRHHCGSGASGEAQATPRVAPGDRLTFRTACWECGKPAFFFRDENGGCALFDSLGTPWPVHSCWEIYQSSNSAMPADYRRQLDAIEQSEQFVAPTQSPERHLRGSPDVIEVSGYVANNHALYVESSPVLLSSDKNSRGAELFVIDILGNSGRLFRFLFPEPVATQIADFEPVRAYGRWLEHRRKWRLLGILIEKLGPRSTSEEIIAASESSIDAKCRYCGVKIAAGEMWGLDWDYEIECGGCGRMRAGRDPSVFAAHCRRIGRRIKI